MGQGWNRVCPWQCTGSRKRAGRVLHLLLSVGVSGGLSVGFFWALANQGRRALASTLPPQVTRLNSFAFPLAEVAVAVMAAQPDFVPLLAARLHQASAPCWQKTGLPTAFSPSLDSLCWQSGSISSRCHHA